MGKIKAKRQRLHIKAAKLKQKKKNEASSETPMEAEMIEGVTFKSPGVFKDIQIDISQLNRNLPDDSDAKSTITSKSFKGLNLTKKDKRKMRHETWMKKMNALEAMKKEVKDKKKRQQTAVVGDLRPLEDTLPTLELLLKSSSKVKTGRPEEKKKAVKKSRTRQKEMMQDISVFKQVLQHPTYKDKPLATITEHLHNTKDNS